MTFSERGSRAIVLLTAVGAWTFHELSAAVTSADKVRLKNIMLTGTYSIDQASEVNSQHGLVGIALMRFPDTVSTPDPDFLESALASGIDRQIFKWRTVWAQGQNNPVLWSMRFKAVNVNPGQKLLLGLRVVAESGASLNHRLNTALRWWQDDG